MLLQRPQFGSDFPTMGCPWDSQGSTGTGEKLLRACRHMWALTLGGSATSPHSSPITTGKCLHTAASSHCPAPRCHQAGPPGRSGCCLSQATASWKAYAFNSEQTHALHIRGKRFYYPMDFSVRIKSPTRQNIQSILRFLSRQLHSHPKKQRPR